MKESSVKYLVASSTYGAQPGENLGDLGVLYDLEQKIGELKIPAAIVRGAYYFSNWDMCLETAREEGKIWSFFPEDFSFPMVAPKDIAGFVADLLQSKTPDHTTSKALSTTHPGTLPM